jgi:Fe-S-cluster containining protein
MPLASNLSKPQREALARQDAPYLAKALILTDPRSNEAHLRHSMRLLADRRVFSPSARTVSHVVELFERSVPTAQKALLACRAGCSFCCHQPVAVTAPEAFYLAALLSLSPDRVAAMEDMAARTRDRVPDAPKVPWSSCPLLDGEGGCTAYRARPLACRAYVSVDVEACRTSHPFPGNGQVMEPRGYTSLKDHFRIILLTAMRANGLPLVFYEMNAAVTAALRIENAEKRWLRGEPIFADLRTITPLSPKTEQVVNWLVQNVAPTV